MSTGIAGQTPLIPRLEKWQDEQDEQDLEMEEEELTEKIIGCAMRVRLVNGLY
jgi:hypothetical protein